MSTLLLLGIERIRSDVRESFSESVSGTDLIVGARTGAVQLLLYSVFRIGSATNNIRWKSVQDVARMQAVAWTVPISLGDSHRGFAVVATSPDYFVHFQYGDREHLRLAEGKVFAGVFDAVLGAEVAERLGYRVGQAHRAVARRRRHRRQRSRRQGRSPWSASWRRPERRSIARCTSAWTAWRRSTWDWVAGVPLPGLAVPASQVSQHDLTPKSVTALLVGLKVARRRVLGAARHCRVSRRAVDGGAPRRGAR